MEYRVRHLAFPWEKKRNNRFDKVRFKARRLKNYTWYTGYYEYFHPRMEAAPWIAGSTPVNQIEEPSNTPIWYDLRMILNHQVSSGSFLRGLDPKTARDAMCRFSLCRDPIGTYKRGGAIVTSTFHKYPSLCGLELEIYNRLKGCKIVSKDPVERYREITVSENILPTTGELSDIIKYIMSSNSEEESDLLRENVVDDRDLVNNLDLAVDYDLLRCESLDNMSDSGSAVNFEADLYDF
jgi:hypothetical protein